MSYQHFYSRVPARVSLYNKRDGFDTFAQSSSLDPNFVLRELTVLYADKLNIHDPIRIRRGEIPVVYSQAPTRSGRVAQTAITYLPFDFTGERSAYLAHTLVLTDEERGFVLNNPAVDIFNPDMFITNISLFNLTAPNMMANAACQDVGYLPNKAKDHKALMSEYNPDMVKSFIYSVICALTQGDREVFFRLPGDESTLSRRAVDFINSITSVLPYRLRERLSFVSYVSDPRSYPGFKVKCVSSSVSSVPAEIGTFYDFSTGEVTGQSADYEKNAVYASFFYSLYEYVKIRDSFHAFVENVLAKCESCPLDLKAMKELCFLFWQCSGFYVERSVLSGDEAISSLLDIYSKYRDGLHTPHRVQMYRCLGRYADDQRAIPDSVFSRMSDLYPTECGEARAVVLDVLLRLIHLDLMRDTIFCFVTRNYYAESDGVKAAIMANLASVFYGGFLQQNLLAFFDMQFRSEPVSTRDLILEKLLLSIRTPEVQRQIVIFLDRHYAILNPAQRLRVCTVCLEMIPECDSLSALLVSLVNRRIGRESGDLSKLMDSKLSEMISISLSAGDGRLAAIFIDNPGFCENIAIRYVLSGAAGSEIIIGLLAAMPAYKRADKLIRAHKISEAFPDGYYAALIQRFATIPVAVAPTALSEVLRQDKLARNTLPKEIADYFCHVVIYPAFLFTLHQAFMAQNADSLNSVIKYAEENPVVAGSAEYRVITDYLAMVNKCQIGDGEAAFKIAVSLPKSVELRVSIAGYMGATAYNPDVQEPETTCVFELVMEYLSTGRFSFDKMYSKYQEYYEDLHTEEPGITKGIKADMRGAVNAIQLIISSASEGCEASDELATLILDDESGLCEAITEFLNFFGPGAGLLLKKFAKDAYFEIEEMVEEQIEERNSSINSFGDAVDFFLRRNNK